MKNKNWMIIGLVAVLILILLVIAYGVIKELKEENNVESTRMTSKKNSNYEDLEQYLTCSGTKPLTDSSGLTLGEEVTTYRFKFTGDKFDYYRKEILYSFNSADSYQNYCLNCDNTEATDIKDLTKGISIEINTSVSKYIYEVVEIDLDEYDGPFKESKYGLDGLDKKSNIDDAIYLTRNMICYWK